MKCLLIIATFDTKGREAEYVKTIAQSLGVNAILMDVGTLEKPAVPPDISAYKVAEAAGYNLDTVKKKGDRAEAVKAIQEGGVVIARQLLQEKKIDGVFGMGGGTGTAIVTYIMCSLPFGFPKVVLSTVASRDVREYVGTKDIVMFHSVADLLGDNLFIRHILEQAIRAACAMMEKNIDMKSGRPMVAVTAYGINSQCALNAEHVLDAKGYAMIGFHANGVGGMAMEEMIEEGIIAGVLDFTPHELADNMYGGYCRGITDKRFEMAGKAGIPLVFAPGGLDNAVFSPFYPMPDILKGRKIHSHDERFCVRLGAVEMKEFARIISEKFNKSKGPIHVLIPKKGWSEADKPGMALFEPDTDRVFVDELKSLLTSGIPIEEMDLHISEQAFADRAVEILDDMIQRR
jgi:uncharacterized protein (UPF0261 family)